MINIESIVYSRVKNQLINSFPKQENGLGFDENNVLDYETPLNLPEYPFDFATVLCTNNVQAMNTISMADENGAVITITLNIYCRNINDSSEDRVDIKGRANLIYAVINAVMLSMRFSRQNAHGFDNHNGKGIFRIVTNYSRIVGNDDIKVFESEGT